ncbi:Haemolymph juvenile hormone binding [Cinara cedri]|uniref:Haemolymph juvenile hormone binding n=1 Tax=Cinara cedri TaxID=506608 RepID=A0A5E4N395_9HEMI|nr:Haemolymph juvenile hormone binding [Cinara cedri]
MTNKNIILFLCVCVFSGNDCRQFRMPSFIKPCKRDDPNINECLKKIFETLRPFTSKGMPEMQILPLDPMSVPSVTLNQGQGSVNFTALFTNLKGYGAKNYQVQKIIADLKKKSMEIDLYFPSFRIESKYEVNGQILLLPIKGNGKFVGNFTNIQTKVKIGLEYLEKKNNKTFIEIKENKVSLIIGAVKLRFNNLFNGNKELGDQTNRFINENWRDLMQEIKPLLEDTVATIVMGIFKPLLINFSMDDLFPI